MENKRGGNTLEKLKKIPEDYVACVVCKTFNHHAYIEDTMNGFCMQKTDFPYICIIIDDCSTDGEPAVIKKYVQEYFNTQTNEETDDYFLNICQHKTNENCCFAIFYLKYNHYSISKSKEPYYTKWYDKCKYSALCEGDDYWIEPAKLQMQVEFLEKNEDYGMCYTKVKRYVQKNNKFLKGTFGMDIDSFDDLLKYGNRIPTLTACFRKEVFDKYIEDVKPSMRGWLMGDYPMWLYFAHETKVKFFDTISGVYRILSDSASHRTSKKESSAFARSYYLIKIYYCKKYNLTDCNSVYFDYYFLIGNREECKKLDSTNLSYKYRIISLFARKALLWRMLFVLISFKRWLNSICEQ